MNWSVFKSKTLWFSILLIIFGALMDSSAYLQTLLDPKIYSVIMILIGVIVGALRALTTVPLNQK